MNNFIWDATIYTTQWDCIETHLNTFVGYERDFKSTEDKMKSPA